MRGFLLAALLSPVAALALAAPAGATVPVNGTPPSILSNPPGTAYVGGGLADAGGSWSATPAPGTAIAFQWLRCDADGQACAPIPGATTTNYTLVLADVGHTIRVQETGSNGPDVSAPVVSAPTVVVRTLPVGVNYTSQPVISGRPVIGQTLRVSNGGWTGTPPITFSYQWQRCGGVLNPGGKSFTIVCVDIPGATQNTYTVTTADAGKLMLAYVTGTNSVSSYRLPASAYTLPVPEPPKTISDALEAVLDLAPGVSRTVSAAELLAAGGYRTSFRALKPGQLTSRMDDPEQAQDGARRVRAQDVSPARHVPGQDRADPEGEGAAAGRPSPADEARGVLRGAQAHRGGRRAAKRPVPLRGLVASAVVHTRNRSLGHGGRSGSWGAQASAFRLASVDGVHAPPPEAGRRCPARSLFGGGAPLGGRRRRA